MVLDTYRYVGVHCPQEGERASAPSPERRVSCWQCLTQMCIAARDGDGGHMVLIGGMWLPLPRVPLSYGGGHVTVE